MILSLDIASLILTEKIKYMEDYEKFKHLLEYYVAHLEWCVNEDKNSLGYENYIKPLIEDYDFKLTGQGYNGDNIQQQIEPWSKYENGIIHINIQQNYGKYQSKKCYLNWDWTGLNVNAKWENNKITALFLNQYKSEGSNALGNEKTLTELGLFDGQMPNITLRDFFDKYNNLIIEWNIMEEQNRYIPYVKLLEEAKNIILTGAPGTGKTYLAKQIARQMIGVKTDEELEKSGQFAFVQFHPSYDYTDFVEGLRPTKPNENGNIGFELKNGIFKDFCKKAIGVSAISVGHIDNFTVEDYEKYLQTLGLNVKTINNYLLRIEQLLGNKELSSKTKNVNIEKYKSLDEICDDFENIRDFDDSNKQHRQFSSSVSNLINFRDNLSTKQQKTNEIKPVFVFVIDEINRGEISKIFGELFFSIDPSYRGKKGIVKTQYSNLNEDENDIFYVPDNVYIIGSMNDIDRSVESFDFAMRRRFTWKEITAIESAENMNLPEETKSRMVKLNEQISKIEGLNNSYHLGGAYFIDSNGNARQDYDTIWELRIVPLLKEYLRGVHDGDEKMEILKTAYSA